MLGAIFGDIVGSVYERFNTKREDFPLLSEWSRPTDDSIMTGSRKSLDEQPGRK